jgi:hypothetical protein
MFRELLCPWHPWFAHRVAVHEAIGKTSASFPLHAERF